MIENLTAAFHDLIVAIIFVAVVAIICVVLCKIANAIYLKVSTNGQRTNYFQNGVMPLNNNTAGFMASNPISHSIGRDKMNPDMKYNSESRGIKVVPRRLYHGTSMEAALDIFRHNRWKAFSLYPSGIYMGDFKTALDHAIPDSGAVVEIQVDIPPSLAVNYKDVVNDPRYQSWLKQYKGDPYSGESLFVIEVMEKRLIKQLNAYIAPLPVTSDDNEYYQIEGIKPLRVLDRERNQIAP